MSTLSFREESSVVNCAHFEFRGEGSLADASWLVNECIKERDRVKCELSYKTECGLHKCVVVIHDSKYATEKWAELMDKGGKTSCNKIEDNLGECERLLRAGLWEIREEGLRHLLEKLRSERRKDRERNG